MPTSDIKSTLLGPADSAGEGWKLDRASLARTGVGLVLFALMAVVARTYRLENETFFQILILAVVGYPFAALAPRRVALGIFALVSLLSVGLAFGFIAGGWLIAIGLGVIGAAHLPVPFRWRVVAVLAVGGLAALLRVEWLPSPVPQSVWPILGAMFMFRTALYLHSIRHGDAPKSVAHAIGYFFMLPNVAFPLFPVVDYKTFAKGHGQADLHRAHLTGLRWVLRGLVQLLLYRYVYFHLVIAPGDVQNLGDLARYVLATYFLYLRVSGQFHLIVGMLQLYGFQLPETHHLYYLASSFTDFWRRINIYWKDFMMKLVYYPSFFRLRSLGDRRALVLATIPVFAATWLLHSYQWFWLRGDFPFTATDAAFWGILAGLVIVGSLRELDPKRRAKARAKGWQLRRGLSTLATFVSIAILWSLWSAESLRSWLDLWGAAASASTSDVVGLATLAALFVAVSGYPWGMKTLTGSTAGQRMGFYRTALVEMVAVMAVLAVGSDWVVDRMPGRAAEIVLSAKESRLNRQDAALQQRGYYEELENINRFNTQLWQVGRPRRTDGPENLSATAAHHARTDWLINDLTPGASVTFLGERLSINSLGMRDREYSIAKAAGTIRVALLGPSDVLGWGVADGETFSDVAEGLLNQDSVGPPVEILNYGVHGYSIVQQLAILRDRVWATDPDVVVVTSHFQMERTVLEDYLTKLSQGYSIDDPHLRSVIRSAGLTPAMTGDMRRRRLAPLVDSVLVWAFRSLHDEIVARGALPVVLGLHPRGPDMDTSGMVPAAVREAGFPILDLTDVMRNLREDQVVSEGDSHPNRSGHERLGVQFAAALAEWQPQLFRGSADWPSGGRALSAIPAASPGKRSPAGGR